MTDRLDAERTSWTPAQWRHAIVILVAIGVLLLLAYRLEHIINPLLISFILAYILDPFVGWLEKKGVPRLAVVIGVYVILAAAAVLVLVLVVPALVNQVIDFAQWIPKKWAALREFLQDRYPQRMSGLVNQVQANAASLANRSAQYVLNSTGSFLGSFFTILNLLILIPLYTFFFLLQFNHMVDIMELYLPARHKQKIIETIREINPLIANFFRGRLIVCGAVGLVTAVGLDIVGVPFAWPLGLATGILNLVPYMAPIIGLPSIVLVSYLSSHTLTQPIYALIVYGAVQFLDGFVLTPIIQGKLVGLHPITTIVVIFIGSDLAGVFGLILAIPATAAVKIIFLKFIWPHLAEATDISPEAPYQTPVTGRQAGQLDNPADDKEPKK